jgi:hypothetical protein
MKNEITISYNTDQSGQINISSKRPMPIDEMLQVTFSIQLAALTDFIKGVEANSKISPQELQTLKEHLYDSYNAGASNVLYLFIPDKELHPDLTIEAMKEAEDRYMYNQLNRKDRRDVDKKTKNQTKILRFPHENNHIPSIPQPIQGEE